MERTVIVVGGGAAGLMAAVAAARSKARVILLEQNEKVGRKLAATGNGRCNFTNTQMRRDAYRGTSPDFAYGALEKVNVQETIGFFSRLGIYTVNKDGWIYPRSGQGLSVIEVLLKELQYRKVKVKTREHVTEILPGKNPGQWAVKTDTWTYEGDAVILACGSKASQIPGSSEEGYRLAGQLGHNIVEPLPALVPLCCKGKSFSSWSGVRTEGSVTLCINGIPLKKETGELQLTEYGISGIPVFQISRYAVRALWEGSQVQVLLDFMPEFTPEGLAALFEERRKNCPYKSTKELLVGMFPAKLIEVLAKEEDLIQGIKEYSLEVTKAHSFESAQICSGGVDVTEISPETMESKLHKGIYFAGEMIDIDGACGGYNLQWAWSSGMVAGTMAARKEGEL